jgi:hypothetical protein
MTRDPHRTSLRSEAFYSLREEANKTFKSSEGMGGRQERADEIARGSETRCNKLGKSCSSGAGEPLMNFEL